MLERSEIECFYFENYDQLVKRMSSRCGSPFDAEDIVQTAFERALKYAHSCNGSMDRWFQTILSNVLKAHQNAVRLGPVTKPIEEHLDDIEPIIWDGVGELTKHEVRVMAGKEDILTREVLRLHLDFGMGCGEIIENISGLTYRKTNNLINAFRLKVLKRYT